MTDAPRTIWAQPTNRHGRRVGQCTDTPVAGTAPYHHDDVVRELREAACAIADHELFHDREYLSRELNEKLDALRAALAKLEDVELNALADSRAAGPFVPVDLDDLDGANND